MKNEMTLHFDDTVFDKLRGDADQVLQKLLSNMTQKGSMEGKVTITIDVSFIEETVQNMEPNIDGDQRLVHTPKFTHKIGSVLQIKNEQKGGMTCDGMEMVWDEERKEYILKPISGASQMSFYDMGYRDTDDTGINEDKIGIPGDGIGLLTTNEDAGYEDENY